jgi:pimeloyl-ACP methyl ester carboxylesterase
VEDLRFEDVAVNGVTLHLAEAGPTDGRLVILLHGFPEYWGAWLDYIEVLAAAGYHVIAHDQRGYNLSGKPAKVSAYDLDMLAADVIGLVDHFGHHRFTVIGHDWGGSVGWWIATRHAERLEQLAVLNAPHPLIWREAMQSNTEQRRRSRYVQFFRLPWLPELLLRQGRFRALVQSISERARPGTVKPEELERYRAAWSAPGALTAMLNWYRAFLRKDLPASTNCRIASRVLLIWGERDSYCVRDLAEASLRLCDNGRAEYVKNATHWVQHDEPERCRELLLEFLKGASVTRTLIFETGDGKRAASNSA